MLVGRNAFFRGIVLVDPWPKNRRIQRWKRQEQIGNVALRINHDRRDTIHRRLFEQSKAKAGLARSGHAQHHTVGHQILRIIKHQTILDLLGLEIVFAPQIKLTKLFVFVG